jgi:hypothetical protein
MQTDLKHQCAVLSEELFHRTYASRKAALVAARRNYIGSATLCIDPVLDSSQKILHQSAPSLRCYQIARRMPAQAKSFSF